MPLNPTAITISVVAPAKMRYVTVGDWQMKGNALEVTVADSGDARTNMLVGLHEAIEAIVYLNRGGSEKAVDEFDNTPLREPYEEHGDMPDAPYHKEHVLGTIIERMLCREMGMTWEDHSENINRADERVEKSHK